MPLRNLTVAAVAAEWFTSEVVSENYRPLIRTVFAEDLIESLLQSDLLSDILSAVGETADKYLLR